MQNCAKYFLNLKVGGKVLKIVLSTLLKKLWIIKKSICLVHPSVSLAKSPGIVVVNSRATKPKCHTCKGFKCLHVNIYLEKAAQEGNGTTTTKTKKTKSISKTIISNKEEDLPVKKKESVSQKCTNSLDPTDKIGSASNVFNIEINFPPIKSEKEQIDRINHVENLFENKIVPKIPKGEECKCGNEFLGKINLGNCESSQVYIHHSRVTKDSRNSTLMALYLETSKCNCNLRMNLIKFIIRCCL